MDEHRLIEAAQRGDVHAYNRLVVAYQQNLYNIAYRILGDADRAMDATQDAFLHAFEALPSFRGGSFRAWLIRIVTNCSYDTLRHHQRRPTTPIDDLIEDDEHSSLLEDDRETPEEHLDRLDIQMLIQKALQTLPEDQRMVVVLSDIEGLDYAEIAQTLSLNLGTVKSRLSRGRAKLRDFLLAHRELLPAGFRLYDE
ncbi:MAG: sigma-70 family RNA polymerase sigma factor [Chloroflexi bacterium]|nr:sigma-70 family RNA polymerase sigma factor [Chloroflexota bacterium]